MLQLKNIVKTYVTGDLRQDALKGVSIAFRESEFVSILGQSGSGKTTMLNIIGGLDRYTDGDLVIGGVSTKKYKDSDWDYYRNSSIGFVFQSYNLIAHQSVLANVEMALTLAGVSKKERRRRALDVLSKVGLADHVHKKPNQMSGGQMQRVAIARALINDPDILLADEPTGALDSETSIQIMELLREIAKDKLVIMVTHNPELAQKYSTRIVKLLDGKIVSDTDPYTPENKESTERVHHPKISMSFFTALSLSFNNLRTKKGRTLLTSFAGSIGIIGIALILALSTGMNAYIADVQRDAMSSYPITISDETIDMSSAMGVHGEMVGEIKDQGSEAEHEINGIYADYTELEISEKITNSFVENDLTSFKKYLDDPESEIHRYLGENGIIYSYDVSFDVFSHDADGKLVDSDEELDSSSVMAGSSQLLSQLPIASVLGTSSSAAANFSELMSSPNGSSASVNSAITESYDMLYGSWPTSYDEVVLVTDKNGGISADALCQLGIITKAQYNEAVEKIKNDEEPPTLELSYEDACTHVFYLVPACNRYVENADGTFSYIEDPALNEENLLSCALELKICGVVRPSSDSASITSAVAYTKALTEYVIDVTNDSAVIRAQEADSTVNVLTGMSFEQADDASKAADAAAYLSSLGISEKASFYKLLMYYSSSSQSVSATTAPTAGEYGDLSASASGTVIGGAANDENAMANALELWLASEPDQDVLVRVYDEYLAGSTYEDNLSAFGKVSYDAPSSISIYTDSFESKDAIADCIAKYNEGVSEDERITYTDYVALLTSSITTIIDGISYVLVAFVAISLIVSCIMIGIITHISVMERTKEIGILRALGASRRNISHVFNAETFIIGCCAGLLGIGISFAALLPINAVIAKISGLTDLRAQLPLSSAIILIAISIVITMIGGLLPSRKAAKKDPVIALRSE